MTVSAPGSSELEKKKGSTTSSPINTPCEPFSESTISNTREVSKKRMYRTPVANMKNYQGQVVGIPVCSSKTYAEEKLPVASFLECDSVASIKETKGLGFNWMSKFQKRSDNLSKGLSRHGALGQNIAETVNKRMSLGKRFLQTGGAERLFRKSFSVDGDERLQKSHHCYLFTTAGPIRGMLFISTKRIAFCSDQPLSLTSQKGETVKVPYKVSVPLRKVKDAMQSDNVNKPEEKYVHIVTRDNFEFWFFGFINYQRSFKHLQRVFFELQ